MSPARKSPKVETHTFDASTEPLGRVATKVASLLMGKHRPSFEKHRKDPVRVIVTRSDDIVFTGRKWKNKRYYRHSGYIGNLKEMSAEWMREHDSRQILRLAVLGMLPKNKLRRQMIKNLVIYKSSESK